MRVFLSFYLSFYFIIYLSSLIRCYCLLLPQVALVTHRATRKKNTRVYFLHARMCRNKGRPGKGSASYEGTIPGAWRASEKWIQLNSYTCRAKLSREEEDVSPCMRATKSGETRRRQTKCVYPRSLLQTEFNEPEILPRYQFEETISTYTGWETRR